MPQLQINQGPQDALLYDNSRSYFTNVGYVRTSNFQVEYRDVEPQNSAQLGSTVQYVIPKAADLLGPVDLCVDLAPPSDWKTTAGDTVASKMEEGKQAWAQWVDEVGFAMIDKVTFSVGSNDIETITGEQLQLKNELMTSDEMRIGHPHILKTGRPHDDFATVTATTTHANGTPLAQFPLPEPSHAKYGVIAAAKCDTGVATDTSRLIAFTEHLIDGATGAGHAGSTGLRDGTPIFSGTRKLIIPLSLFFTKHVSQYFPLAAVAGCNDVRISIKFRPLNELVQVSTAALSASTDIPAIPTWANGVIPSSGAKLRCHYVHVTGPEAQLLMNKEHVRLMKLYQHQFKNFTSTTAATGDFDMDLSFLHPVSTLLITVRRTNDMNTDTSGNDCAQKGHFFYHGDGANPNYDRSTSKHTVKVNSISLTLNGQTE